MIIDSRASVNEEAFKRMGMIEQGNPTTLLKTSNREGVNCRKKSEKYVRP